MSVFDNAGQDCCARSRILVERSVYDRFLELLEQAVKAVRVETRPWRRARWGPHQRQHRERVASYVPEGAPVAFRGSCPMGPGTGTHPPSSPPSARRPCVPEEIFGPVVAVVPFDDEAGAIRAANDSEYGLSGSI